MKHSGGDVEGSRWVDVAEMRACRVFLMTADSTVNVDMEDSETLTRGHFINSKTWQINLPAFHNYKLSAEALSSSLYAYTMPVKTIYKTGIFLNVILQ